MSREDNRKNNTDDVNTGPKRRVDTRLVTLGRRTEDYFGFVNPPLFRGSTVFTRR
jgi:cystathionine beta-lyase/cystathionine gamma-synthase